MPWRNPQAFTAMFSGVMTGPGHATLPTRPPHFSDATGNALRARGQNVSLPARPLVDRLVIAAMMALVIADLASMSARIAAGIAGVAALLHVIRVRVFGPSLLPFAYPATITAATITWTAAFGLFLYVYTPILLEPRVDGRPG